MARQKQSPTNKIVTAEDPIEFELPGLIQVQVQPSISLTYEKILRSLLHQDPDIILIGEIRDKTSMEIAMEAALTGHLVLSSLHTNSAFETVMRLRQRGIEPYVIASALKGVVSQRLLPRLCTACAEESPPDTRLLEMLQTSQLVSAGEKPKTWRAPGCTHCRMTGHRGRIGIYEVLLISDSLRETIEHAASLHDMHQATPPGTFLPMRRYARHVMEKGLVSPEDLIATFPAVQSRAGHEIVLEGA
jgi:type II secretory ATPase GspE/PulE/Tfp pilus assembly ATPase PilB-like protein